jgi:protocadherin-16/23
VQHNIYDLFLIRASSPVFPPHSVISVHEDVPVGTLITTMVANDVDTNPTLVYGFTEDGNPGNMFSIGKYSGRVTLVKPLDFELAKSYTAKIQVSDSVHTAYTTLTVNVLDSNDHRPRFSNDVYRIIVSGETIKQHFKAHPNILDR